LPVTAQPQITAAIVSWNTRELLGRCLASLRPDAEAGLLEAVVVDNGSSDGSAEMAAAEHPWARLLRPEENLGFGGGANLGVDGATTPWLLIANADVEFAPGAVRRLLAAGEAAPEAGIVAPRLLSPDGSGQPIFAFPSVTRTLLDNAGLRRLPHRGVRDWIDYGCRWDPASTQWIEWAMGAALLVRRDAFEACGGFDPAQWMYAEDLDLAWRLRQAGRRTLYVGAATAEHAAGSSSGQAFDSDAGRALVTQAYYDWVLRRLGRARFWAMLALSLAGAWIRRVVLAPPARLGSERAASLQRRFAVRTRSEWSGAMAARARGSSPPPSTRTSPAPGRGAPR
jgi:GT2 family glycosyltransferase